MSETKQPHIETIKTLKDAWLKGDLKYQRSLTYLQKPAKLGYVYYLINYEEGENLIYRGAYEIKLALEEELIRREQLYLYLTFLLAGQLE
ncbi:hypothetical protein IDJ77_11250 [Mucilaginibacter sp. ZT4R22]|uniref:Uncharacterized protein n=1 Tax=Mucilaginibacter pankratovii TaxID=2772110 RepID=A0ABR7WPX7_9SPHI|nr:hypothetical protein [Mucilaginibacter pankratovii]MBD1364385.1 hypothetical protein [Mucilaginibacter pankratovii]